MHERENKDARIIYDPQPKNLHTVMASWGLEHMYKSGNSCFNMSHGDRTMPENSAHGAIVALSIEGQQISEDMAIGSTSSRIN